ncbi:MAG: hypothetical protein K5650_02935 [Bacteroidales bacterium]|nr:hypothetical protein [Bacteroidales bacterium]
MKNVIKMLCAAMLLMSFAACTEKENENDKPGGGDNNNYSTLLLGTWSVDQMSVNGENRTPQYMQLSFYEGGRGLMDDGDSSHHNDFTWVISGSRIDINTGNHQFSYTIDNLTATECSFHGNYIQLGEQEITGDIRFHLVKVNGDNPGDPDPGDLGIGTPELAERSATSLRVTAHVTGSVSQYLGQFPNYTCGIIWCLASDSTPTMNSNMIVCNTDSDGNFEGTITGLTAGTSYNLAAWLKLTPDSEPIISDVRTYTTDNEGGDSDTNWINIDSISVINSTSVSVTVTGYFDDNPIGIGAVYNTTGSPTLSDQVYNAFEHLITETGQGDETILGMIENPDGSRIVTVMLGGLQPGTTYYFRGFIQFAGSTPTIYSNEASANTTD